MSACTCGECKGPSMNIFPEEISFWEKIYLAKTARGEADHWSAEYADNAVEQRRRRMKHLKEGKDSYTPYRGSTL